MWLEQSEQGGEREEMTAGTGQGQVMQGFVGHRRTWAFTLREVGALRVLGEDSSHVKSAPWLRCEA